jgi:mannose-6-phosphate isomerase-like protein (cupin superfamily)
MPETTTARPYVLHEQEGDALWFVGNLVTIKATQAQTHGRASVMEFLNPPGFAPPLHRHLVEDEMFYVLSGTVRLHCGDESFSAGPGDFVCLPAGLPHTFVVSADEPLRALQITTPGGFEDFATAVGRPADSRRLPDPAPIDPATMAHAAEQHAIEILGPPPTA